MVYYFALNINYKLYNFVVIGIDNDIILVVAWNWNMNIKSIVKHITLFHSTNNGVNILKLNSCMY